MVTGRAHRRLDQIRVLASGILAALLTACGSDGALVPSSDAPFLYVVVSPGPASARAEGPLRAMLLTTGTPLSSPFRDAQLFELYRLPDSARYSWTKNPDTAPGDPVGFRGISLAFGNYVLAEQSGNGTLGRRDLVSGASYSLRVVTGGRTIHGQAVLPMAPNPRIVLRDGRRMVVWSAAAGAAAYLFDANTESGGPRMTTDTVFELRYDRGAAIPPGPELWLTAVDANLFRYVTDTGTVSAGLTGAFGVFGATATTRIPLPNF